MLPTAPRVAIIGGGATGCGVARDLALRGFEVTLIEHGDLGCGTSSRFHGMLQSGARYAVSDTGYAAECMRERRIVARLAPEAVEETGGLFVNLAADPPGYADRFLAGCRAASIPVEELDPERVMAEEPNISRAVRRAFAVPDATVQSWRLLNLLADDVRLRGGQVLLRHSVLSVRVEGGRVTALTVLGPSGQAEIGVDAVVNAAGSWSGEVARLFGDDVELELTKGSIIVFAHRMVGKVINRCRPPSSNDIMVPTGTVSLFGTTSQVVDDPNMTAVQPDEIQALLDGAEPLVPGIRDYRALRAWAGVRPLVRPPSWPEGQPLSRRHKVIDHTERGITGAFTVCGGSLTTHRSMAEDVANHVCRMFGIDAPSCSAEVPLLSSRSCAPWRPTGNYEVTERNRSFGQLLCECEGVGAASVGELVDGQDMRCLHDLRRRLRVGFGPCQGTFCGSRLAAMVADAGGAAQDELERFWSERLKGARHTAYGASARQALLGDLVFREILGIELRGAVDPRGDDR